MKSIIICLCLLSCAQIPLLAQCDDGQLTRESWGRISNNHRANIAFTYGMISYQLLEDNFYFDSPEDSLFYLGYGKSLWTGARDADGNLRIAANSFPMVSTHDYIPGPLDRTTGTPLDTFCSTYNRVWRVTQFEIFQMQTRFQDGTLTLSDIPTDILEWPAIGNPHLENGPDFELAPFHDRAEDGIYDPLSGDHPIVMEENPEFIPSQFSFIVYNDGGRHTVTGSAPIQIEYQQINYVVNCAEDTESDHTVYTRVKYKYLGQEPLAEFKISLFEDNDLACNENDYGGCNLDLNCSYYYNQGGETFIGPCHDFDVPDDNGAIRSTVFLSHEMKTYKHFFLFGVGDPIVPGIDPTGVEEHYNYMSGLWRDGVPQTVGGVGYDPASSETTLFAYPDRPDDEEGWSMETAGLPIPQDIRALTTLVDERDVQPGAEGVIDFADYFLYDPSRKKLSLFEVWPEKVEALKREFAEMQTGDFDCSSGLDECTAGCVWPGDANNDLAVTGKVFLFTGIWSGQALTDGIPRTISSTEWFAFNANDWSSSLANVNAKHGDVNGNGAINENDLFAIEENFGLSRDNFTYEEELFTPSAEGSLLVTRYEENEIDLTDAQVFDKIVGFEVALEPRSGSGQLETAFHGLTFDMRFDTNMVTPFVLLSGDENEVFQYGFDFMANSQRNGNELNGDNRVQYAFTNYNGTDVSEGGLLVSQNMWIRDDAVTSNPDGRDTLVISLYNVCAVTSEGAPVEFGALYDTLIITNLRVDPDVISSTTEIVESNSFRLVPNPVGPRLQVSFDQVASGTLRIYDLQGRLMDSEEIAGSHEKLMDTTGLASGLYLMEYVSETGFRASEIFVKVDE